MADKIHNPLEQFQIKEIIPIEFLGYNISFTNSSLFMCLAVVVVLILLGLSVKNPTKIPSRIQAFGEVLYEFLIDMIDSTAGPEAKKFAPVIFSLFVFILVCNFLGLVPYSFTVTSHIVVTFAMAIFVFLGVTLIGFIRHGFHFFSLFLPQGVPLLIAPFIIPIELFAYLVRPVSLSVRLAANMTAGHVAMKVVAGFIIMFPMISIFPFALLTLLVGFEIFVAVLQAYIFTILSCVYLNDAMNLH
jgi:F-type H+-transporting ATPase subunit a